MATPPALAEFRFTRDWIHAGMHYAPGDTARLPDHAIAQLVEQGAGAPVVPSAPRRRPHPHE